METRTLIDQITIEPQTGQTLIRMLKQVIADDGVTVLSTGYHRTSIGPDTDPSAQMAAVNAHLAQMGYPAAKAEDVAVLTTALEPLASHRAVKAQEIEAARPKK
jgi:hypothetical protein